MRVASSTMATIRFGYGFHPDQAPPRDGADLLGQLEAADPADLTLPGFAKDDRREAVTTLLRLRRQDDADALRAHRRALRKKTLRELSERVFRRAVSPFGFFERLSAFWSDHFSISYRREIQLLNIFFFEAEAIRPSINGYFSDMLKAVAKHPAMLLYLDQNASFGPNSPAGARRGRGLNENLAREILELHTLGVDGTYTQDDVREFAELLTGYQTPLRTFEFRFNPDRAEPGPETILGRTYGGAKARLKDVETALEDLALHPDTAAHIARKLAVHFVADDPDAGLVRALADTFRRTDGYLPAMYETLLDHKAAWKDFGAKVKQPQDLVISTLRAIGVDEAQIADLDQQARKRVLNALKGMNQAPFRAPGPDGWPEEAEAWITPQGLAARIAFASDVGHFVADRSDIDPRQFAERALRDALQPNTAFAVRGAPDRWEGIAFALASPEFNRR